jgi:hypothetical protein
MPQPHAARKLLVTKGGSVHQWLDNVNWMWMSAVLVGWILLIAVVGYAAALADWQGNEPHAHHRRPKRV